MALYDEVKTDTDLSDDVKTQILEFLEHSEDPEPIARHLLACAREKRRLRKSNRKLWNFIESLRKQEQKLLKRLYFNDQTGLPNHFLMARDLVGMIKERNRLKTGLNLAVIVISLDETFDVLKKTQKSIVSEWVIYRTSNWLKEIVPGGGKVYQSQDQEFLILIPEIDGIANVRAVLERISRKISEVHRFPAHNISIGAYIGCSVYPDHGTVKSDLLRCADISLAVCRENNRNYMLYEPRMAEEMLEKVELRNGILKALEEQAMKEMNGQFELYFQPVVKVTSLNGDGLQYQTMGSECLLRWKHPEKGFINPSKFIPLAEESGLIIPIGNWVFYKATEKLRQWCDEGYENLFLSINISPMQFNDPYLIENISRIVTRRKIDPRTIQLEITETSVMEDPEASARILAQIHDIGIKISIDDFGTGYSSLSYLKDLTADSLKIDKSFIDNVATNPQNQGIVRAVISMAQSLGMDILAEGVEDQQQLEFVHKEGCSNIQGYFFSKPLAVDAFEAYLAKN